MKQILTVGLLLLVSSSLVVGLSSGPPDGATKAPGESVCTFCHESSQLNRPVGSLMLTASAPAYHPRDTLNFVVHLSCPGQRRWGFELTCLDSLNNKIGTILDTSVYTQVSINANGRQYLKQTSLGTFADNVDSSPGWGFRWVAPLTERGSATFYLAGNAANGSGDEFGDSIYAISKTIPQLPPLPCCFGATGNVDCDPGDNVDIADLTAMVDNLFLTFTSLCCPAEANVDGVGAVDIGDLTRLVDFLFLTFTPLENCP